MPIRPYLNDHGAFFAPAAIRAMSLALNEVCTALHIGGKARAKESVAIRIIELARRGERDATKLRDRVVAEAKGC